VNAALSWLNDLMVWLGRWVPRLVLVEPTHAGVLFGPRGGVTPKAPGLTVYWPIAQNLRLVPVTTQSVQTNATVVPGLHVEGVVPKVTIVAMAVQYRVEQPVLVATRVLHSHALVDNRTKAAIARHAHIRDEEEWEQRVFDDIASELLPFGLVVERVDITQLGTGVALKNVSDWSFDDHANGTRPE
jgi:regulator of protease activity HflC (stomatin/prohibitin superfamily)